MATSFKNAPEYGLGVEIQSNGAGPNGKCAPFAIEAPLSPQVAEASIPQHFWGWNELLRIGQRYLQKFISLLPLVLEDNDPIAVHKMRVASRRLEQVLTLIYSKPLPAYARKLRRRARLCRHLLGSLGDCDILLLMTERELARDPAQDAIAWKAVAQFLRQQRARISPRILKELAQIEFASPCSKFQRDLEENGGGRRVYCDGKFQKLTSEKADQVVQQRILHSLAHLWREFESVVEESHEDPCEEVIHNVRIATKRLRNLVEVMKKLGISGSAETLVPLRQLQGAIGEWHDMEVLEHLTSKLLTQKKFVRDHLELAVEIEQLFLRNREIKRTSEEKFRRLTVNSSEYQQIKSWSAGKLPVRAHPVHSASRPAAVPAAPDSVQ